nr:hypothetical protein [Tanacetum cinerariifolium]
DRIRNGLGLVWNSSEWIRVIGEEVILHGFKDKIYADLNFTKRGAIHCRRSTRRKELIDSGCSTHMTRNKCYLTDYEDYDGGFASFGDGKFDRKADEGFIIGALVIKPHNKTPYELIRGRPPLINFIKPFGCHVTILNTRDHLGKFDRKADEGFIIGYYMVSKSMRVVNKRTMIVEETLNIRFFENAPNMKGNEPDWIFDIDSLTIFINYEPVVVGKQTNGIARTKDNIVAGQVKKMKEPEQEYVLIPICTTDPLITQGPKDIVVDTRKKATEVDESRVSDNGGQDDQVTRNKWAIGTKWVFRNGKDEKGIVIKEEVCVYQPLSFEDPDFLNKSTRGQIDKTLFIKRHKDDILLVQVYVDDIIFGSPKKGLSTEFEKLMHDKFQMSSMGELSFFLGLQVQQKSDGVFISQHKYMANILKKFDFSTVKTASTPMEPNKQLVKDAEAEDVDVHLCRSMIGSLMYLTASRRDITFAIYACARDSPFYLEAYSDSDYARASLDRKSTTGEYVAAANCYRQVLWIQSQMHDYRFNFLNTKIYIDNESTIYIVKNPLFHSKTKHIEIEIRHHFIRDSYEKKLI